MYLRQLAKKHLLDYNKAIRCPTDKGQKERTLLEVRIMELRSQEVRTLAPENASAWRERICHNWQ